MKNITVSIGNTAISGSVQDVAELMKYISADGSAVSKKVAVESKSGRFGGNSFHKHTPEKECAVCGRKFLPNSNIQKYCDARCRMTIKKKNAVKWYYKNREEKFTHKNIDAEIGELQLEERLQDNGSQPLVDHIYGHRE